MLPRHNRRRSMSALLACLTAGLSACVWDTEGAQVAVMYRTSDALMSDAQAYSGLVVVYSTTLNRCEALAQPWHRPLLQKLGELALPRAWAHAEASPNRFATPVLLDIHSDDYWSDAAIRPDRGTYCSVTLEFAPADADTMRLALHPEMLGRTLDVWMISVSNDEISVHSSEETELVIDLEQPLRIDADTDVVMTVDLQFAPLLEIADPGRKHLTTTTDLDVLAELPPRVSISIAPRMQ